MGQGVIVADTGLGAGPSLATPSWGAWLLALGALVAGLAALRLLLRRRYLNEMTLLADVATAVAGATSDTSELAETAYLQAARLLDTDFFQLGLFHGSRYRTVIWIRDGDRQPNEDFVLDQQAAGLIGWVRSHNQILRVRDFSSEAERLPARPAYASPDPPASGLFAPILVGAETMGVLAVQSRRRAAFGRPEEERLRFLAACVASGLESITHRTRSENRERHFALLQEVSELLVPLRPLPEVLPEIAERMARYFGGDSVTLLETTSSGFAVMASSHPGETESLLADSAARQLFQGVVEGRRPIQVAPEAPTDADSGRAHLAVPLRVQDRVLGVLSIQRTGGSYSRLMVSLAEMLAGQLAMAMLEAANYAQQQEEAWFTTVLLEVARHAAQPGDWGSALQAVLQLSTLLTGTPWTILLLPGERGGDLVVGPVAGLRRPVRDQLAGLRLPIVELGLAAPYPVESPVPIPLPEAIARIVQEARGTMTVLGDGETLLGVWLLAGEDMQGRRLSLMAGIAHQMSLRLENTRLVEEAAVRRSLERELATARAIQESFLPASLPSPGAWSVASLWRAARMVGGDFYDFIPLRDGPNGPRWGVAIADVADKGVPAALFMALARTLLRSVAIGRIDPGPTLSRLNDLIFHDTRTDLFVSIFYAVWEPVVGKLTYANAGHCPPLFVAPDRQSQLLKEHGILVGVLEDVTYRSHTLTMPPGSLLLLYTDGVTDTEGADNDLFGMARLESLILSMDDWEAPRVTEAIAQRLLDFSHEPVPADDVTVIALYRRP
jgi:serine phosphatase RsbU (regulator of sigma subunit)/transcriptional regulator with GAF, ATPase, and Fis domain